MQPFWMHVRTEDVCVITMPVALLESNLTPMVVYAKHPGKNHQQGMMLPGPFWCRPVDEFLDGRFRQLTEPEVKAFLGRQ